MTPSQKLKHLILIRHDAMESDFVLPEVTAENVDALYDAADKDGCGLQDAREEVRGGEVVTDLRTPSSRHYEAKPVAANVNGSWIGWTYWYGGGKHAEPEAVDWIEDAYDLHVTEETKTVVVQTFTKVEQAA